MKRLNLDKKSIALVAIIVLTGTASFGLGRMSVAEQYKAGDEVAIIVPDLAPLDIDKSTFSYTASKNGTRYYPIGCKSADRIKEENRVYFMTEEEAQDEGLTRAAGCSF